MASSLPEPHPRLIVPPVPAGPDHPDLPGRGSATIVIARGDSGHGELALRRRGDVLELVVDGVFAMDTVRPTTEKALARLSLTRLAEHRPAPDRLPRPGWRVLVGGLGLGFTARAVLADPRVAALDIVELQPLLVDWIRDGLVPPAAGVLDDPRVRVLVDDVRGAITRREPGGLDALLLDVDNGPDFLVHEHNAALYRPPFLRAAVRALAPGGVLAIWAADPSPALPPLLRAAGATDVEEVLLDVDRDGRQLSHALYLARPHPG